MAPRWNNRDQSQLIAMARRNGVTDAALADKMLEASVEALARLLPAETAAAALERAAATIRAKGRAN